MKRRLFSLALVLCLVLSMVPFAAQAEEIGSGTFCDTLSWSLSDTGTLTISGNGPMTFNSSSENPWNNFKNEIKAVVINKGITAIGSNAFSNCYYLTSLSIPSTVETIGFSAFANCNALTAITIPEGVVSIGEKAFNQCEEALSLSLPSTLTTIGDMAFANCKKLTVINIPASVESIGWAAFSNSLDASGIYVESGNPNYVSDSRGVLYTKDMAVLLQAPGQLSGTYDIPNGVTTIEGASFFQLPNLSTVNIPGTVTSIGEQAFSNSYITSIAIPGSVEVIDYHAFYGCDALTTVQLGSGLSTIGDGAFGFCTDLTSIRIPASVTSIGEDAFYYCPDLTGIHVSGDNPNYCSDASGVLFSKDMLALIAAPGAISGHYHVPDVVLTIEEDAFYNCVKLTGVTISDSVTLIGYSAFSNCENLSSVTLGSSVATIDNFAFTFASMSRIRIPASVESIGFHAFSYCENLKRISFEGNAPDIDEEAFNEYVTANAYYPEGNPTWTSDVLQNYGGTLVWSAFDPSEPEPTDPEPTEPEPTEPEPTEPEPTEPKPAKNPFKDVKSSDYFYEPVLWAVGKGITSGVSSTRFAPHDSCTRGQVVTFLWRAAGCPKPTSAKNPFKDVKKSAFYYDAVLWAVENGITTGTGATTFSPNSPCTRGQVVTFLHRAAGEPQPTKTSHPFADVKSSGFYFDAVLWAVENGITTGTSSTRFSPNQTCTRGQVVTFLYRANN